jgi:DNA mismatch repair protein MutH
MALATENELLHHAKKLEGMRISNVSRIVKRLDQEERRYTKGLIGEAIESGYFGLSKNPRNEVDFMELGIELKVSPLTYNEKKGLVIAKERNVIGMVDYNDVLKSESWHNNKRLSDKLGKVLFVFYLHDYSRPAQKWKVVSVFLWTPSHEQDRMIQKDYEIIRSKVVSGERNREGDNTFLGTCPKHGGGYVKSNPCESEPGALCQHPRLKWAEKRGFCLRNSAVVMIVAEHLGVKPVRKGRTFGIPPEAFGSCLKGAI